MAALTEVLPGVWRGVTTHPDWTPDEGGDDGWDPEVAWWAARTSRGLLVIDPLVEDWAALDGLVEDEGGCAGIVRLLHWHQRSIADVASRYAASVWALKAPAEVPRHPFDHGLADELWDGIRAFPVQRDDEIALWLPAPRALLFADAMLRRAGGTLRVCPASWTQTQGDPALTRARLAAISAAVAAEHVLVCHGPAVTGDGPQALRVALTMAARESA